MDTQGKSGIDIKTVEDAIRLVEASKLTHIKVGCPTSTASCAASICARTSSSARCARGSRSAAWCWGGTLTIRCTTTRRTRVGTAYPDAQVRIIPQSCRRLPLEIMNGEPMLFFLAEFAGDAEDICPRGVLRRVIKRRRPGLRRVFGAGIRVLRVRGNASQRARKELPEPQELDARELRLFDPAQHGEQRFLSRPHRHDRDHGHADRGTAHRDGAGRAGGRAGGRRSGDGRQGHAVQVLHQGPGPAQRPDGHVHGEVVAHEPGQSGHIHMSLRERESGKSAFHDESRRTT